MSIFLPRIVNPPLCSSRSDSCLLFSLSHPSYSLAHHGAYSHEAHRTRTRQTPKTHPHHPFAVEVEVEVIASGARLAAGCIQ